MFKKGSILSSYLWKLSIAVVMRKGNIYLSTEWEARTGKYLARGHDVWTKRCKVRSSWPIAKYSPIQLDLTQSLSILLQVRPSFFFPFFGFPILVLFHVAVRFRKLHCLLYHVGDNSQHRNQVKMTGAISLFVIQIFFQYLPLLQAV